MRILTCLFIVISFTIFLISPAAAQTANPTTFHYAVNRNDVPDLYYPDLTLKIQVNNPTQTSVTADSSQIPFTYVENRKYILVTSPAASLSVAVSSPASSEGLGSYQVTPLKNDKRWAWSHGMDDNVNWWCGGADSCNSIEHFRAKGYRATLFLITNILDTVTHDVNNNPAVRNESWIMDESRLQQLITAGWGIGNHDHDKSCSSSQNIATANAILAGVIARSTKPTYKLLSYAAPNFDPTCETYLRNAYGLTATDGNTSYTSRLLVSENGNGLQDGIIVENFFTSGGVNLLDSSRHIVKLYRESKGYDAAYVKTRFDYMSANSTAATHRWFNTLTHADGDDVKDFVTYFDTHYGTNGTNEAWMAPEDEIYSYILTAKLAVITSDSPAVSPSPSPSATPTSSPSPTPSQCVSIYHQSSLPGNAISLAGVNFGNSGTLTLNNQSVTITRWSPELIEAVVPANSNPGNHNLRLTSPGCIATLPITIYDVDPSFLTRPAYLQNIALGKPVYYTNATSTYGGMGTSPTTVLTRNNNRYGGGVAVLSAGSIVALDLGVSLNQDIWFSFFGDANYYSGYRSPTDYFIEGSNNSTNGTDGTWINLLSVVNNGKNSRVHKLNPQGNRWLRLRATSVNQQWNLREIRVHQRTVAGSSPVNFFTLYGDSQTANDMDELVTDYFFPSLLSNLQPDSGTLLHYIAGMSGQNAGQVAAASTSTSSLAYLLEQVPDTRYVAIAIGTNDSDNTGLYPSYKARIKTGIDLILAAGKVPILARIPDTTVDGYGDEVGKRTVLAAIDQLNAEYRLIPGPDFFTPFRYNILYQQASYLRDGTHHTDAGAQLVNQMWANTLHQSGIYSPPEPTNPTPGDANGDNRVDGIDYMIWRSHYNQTLSGASNGDFNQDNHVDGLDYMIWRSHYTQ